MINRMLEEVYELVIHFSGLLAWLFAPVKQNRIVLTSFCGNSYGGDTALIAEQLLSSGEGLEVIWLLKDLDVDVPSGVRKFACYDSQKKLLSQIQRLFLTQRLLSSARVLAFDTKDIVFYCKSRHSLYLQTGHGAMPFKLIEGECESELGRAYLRHSKSDSRRIDVLLSSCSLASKMFRQSFWLREDCKIWEVGVPRHDYYYRRQEVDCVKFRKYCKIPSDVKIAVYAPTFRDDGATDVYSSMDYTRVANALTAYTGKRWVIVTRLHPNVRSFRSNVKDIQNNASVDVSRYVDGKVIFSTADLLITDVSTVIYDFMVMKKPILLYFPDYEHYMSECRPVRDVYYSLPMKICYSTEDVVREINSGAIDTFAGECQEVVKRLGLQPFDDGHVVEHVSKMIRCFCNNADKDWKQFSRTYDW